jgi:hypothetical protein
MIIGGYQLGIKTINNYNQSRHFTFQITNEEFHWIQ